jgi:AGCS family alanine or glycine:cation symporter
MAIPNLIALVGLSGIVVSETKMYFTKIKNNQWVEDEPVEELKKAAVR